MDQLSELRRSTTDGRVAGVCVMLADRWRVDPLLVRVAALLLALSSGIGLVLYAAAWAMIPPEGSDQAPIDGVLPGVRRLGTKAGVALLVAACILAAALVGQLLPFGIGPALVIGAVWYFGWYRPQQRRNAAIPPPPAEAPRLADRPFAYRTPFTAAAEAWQRRVHEYQHAQAGPPRPAPPSATDDPGYSMQAFLTVPDPVGLYQHQPAPQEPVPEPETVSPAVPARPRRRTGRLQLIGWSLTLILLGALAALDLSHAVPWYAYPAAALLAVGLTLVIGTLLPRPRGLVVVGALLAVIVGLGTAPMPETPVTTATYTSVADLPVGVTEHEVGDLRVDLSALQLTDDATYAVQVDIGRVTIIAPPDTNVRIVWTVEAGQARLADFSRSGLELSDTTTLTGSDPSGPILTIEAHVDLGELEVTR